MSILNVYNDPEGSNLTFKQFDEEDLHSPRCHRQEPNPRLSDALAPLR